MINKIKNFIINYYIGAISITLGVGFIILNDSIINKNFQKVSLKAGFIEIIIMFGVYVLLKSIHTRMRVSVDSFSTIESLHKFNKSIKREFASTFFDWVIFLIGATIFLSSVGNFMAKYLTDISTYPWSNLVTYLGFGLTLMTLTSTNITNQIRARADDIIHQQEVSDLKALLKNLNTEIKQIKDAQQRDIKQITKLIEKDKKKKRN